MATADGLVLAAQIGEPLQVEAMLRRIRVMLDAVHVLKAVRRRHR